MGGFFESVKLLNWFTLRVEQVSKFIKNTLKDHNEKKIDTIVDTLDDDAVERVFMRIHQKREARRNQS